MNTYPIFLINFSGKFISQASIFQTQHIHAHHTHTTFTAKAFTSAILVYTTGF